MPTDEASVKNFTMESKYNSSHERFLNYKIIVDFYFPVSQRKYEYFVLDS